MAGYIANGICVDYADGEGSAVVNGRTYRWDYTDRGFMGGPTFYRKDGEPLKRFPGVNHPIWPVFSKWLKKYERKRKRAKSHEVVVINL